MRYFQGVLRRAFFLGICLSLLLSSLAAQEDSAAFVRGDVNQDALVDFSDGVATLLHLFRPDFAAPCLSAADTDDDGQIQLNDAVYTFSFLVLGGEAPPAPFPRCGIDLTADGLSCLETPCPPPGSATLRINEFLASNAGGRLDEDRDSSDWIEIVRTDEGLDPFDLGGYYLTDDAARLDKWRFPSGVPIEDGDELLVFASGKDRAVPGDQLHANFELDASGEYLALVAPDGVTVVDEFAPAYPEQLTDISYGVTSAGELGYMTRPSPGSSNRSGSVDFVRDVVFSVERGFYEDQFLLELATPTGGSEIRYTTDGSTPSRTRGEVYDAPIRISSTRAIRAMAHRSNHLDSEVVTHSYFFVADVVDQSRSGQRPGSDWPAGDVNGQDINYGMDPDITDDPRWSSQMERALLDIPTISLVTDIGHFFSPTTGIYVNARNDGIAWERPTSIELIHPDGTPGFAENAGVRIRGAFSRSGDNPKHSLRIIFRRDYGPGRLRYPLFGGEGTDEFDRFDLRTSQNYSWAFQGSDQNTFMREVFSRDTQRDMRQPYTRTRYYHLYINNHYWGLYMTQERADAEFAQSYLGGRDEDYDVIKNDSSGSRALQATDGNMSAYRRLYDAAVQGFTTDTRYRRILGQRSDGTPDPNGERLIDPENLMDYMICTYYVGDPDAPISAWAHFSNNIFAIYNRNEPDGFKWFRHDAEHSLGSNGGLNEARLLTDATDRRIGERWEHFNPAWLHLRLTGHPEYLLQFADRVNAYFHHGGCLTPLGNVLRWNERAAQINLAVLGASARWGDSKRSSPRTPLDWSSEVGDMRSNYFPRRTEIVLGQMRSVNMFPREAIVSFNQHGGGVEPGFELLMSQDNGSTASLYYTLDGEDPREWGGALSDSAQLYDGSSETRELVAAGSRWRYLDDGSNQGAAWRRRIFSGESSWDEGPAPLGYGEGDEATVVNSGPDGGHFATTYFRHSFDFEGDPSEVVGLTISLMRDDGAAVYLNGTEVARTNLEEGATHDDFASGGTVPVGNEEERTFFDFGADPDLLREGSNVLAVEIHQASGASSDISFDLSLSARLAGEPGSAIVISESTTVKARVKNGNRWGALTEARFTVGLDGLRINEIVAENDSILEDPDEPGEYPDFIELYNGSGSAIDLSGMYLSDDPFDIRHWQIAEGVSIAPGDHLVFFADDDGTQGPLHTNFQLSRNGESVFLVDRDGRTILDVLVYDRLENDEAVGLFPDGEGSAEILQAATPGEANLAPRP